MKVAVIGAGGIGSYVVPALQKSLNAGDSIVVFDGDRFEKKNLDRQLFKPRDIGKNKAEAIARMWPSHNDVVIGAVPEYIKDSVDFANMYEDIDVIFACPDNNAARMCVLDIADNMVIPAILCGNEYKSSEAMVYESKYKGTMIDPRVRYPELQERDGRDPLSACTGVLQEENKQLASSNRMAAEFGVKLFELWYLDEEHQSDEENGVFGYRPVEHFFGCWRTSTKTVDDLLNPPAE